MPCPFYEVQRKLTEAAINMSCQMPLSHRHYKWCLLIKAKGIVLCNPLKKVYDPTACCIIDQVDWQGRLSLLSPKSSSLTKGVVGVHLPTKGFIVVILNSVNRKCLPFSCIHIYHTGGNYASMMCTGTCCNACDVNIFPSPITLICCLEVDTGWVFLRVISVGHRFRQYCETLPAWGT